MGKIRCHKLGWDILVLLERIPSNELIEGIMFPPEVKAQTEQDYRLEIGITA